MTDYRPPIREFIVGRFPGIGMDDSDDIFALGFVNSLFALELVMFIEKSFGITLPNSEVRLDNFRSVERMGDLVAKVTADQPRPV